MLCGYFLRCNYTHCSKRVVNSSLHHAGKAQTHLEKFLAISPVAISIKCFIISSIPCIHGTNGDRMKVRPPQSRNCRANGKDCFASLGNFIASNRFNSFAISLDGFAFKCFWCLSITDFKSIFKFCAELQCQMVRLYRFH